MPDENRSEQLPFSSRNEPPLQRKLLEFLLDHKGEWHTFDSLVETGEFGQDDKWAVLRAIKSLCIEDLVLVNQLEEMRAAPTALHFHWLMTEVERLDG